MAGEPAITGGIVYTHPATIVQEHVLHLQRQIDELREQIRDLRDSHKLLTQAALPSATIQSGEQSITVRGKNTAELLKAVQETLAK